MNVSHEMLPNNSGKGGLKDNLGIFFLLGGITVLVLPVILLVILDQLYQLKATVVFIMLPVFALGAIALEALAINRLHRNGKIVARGVAIAILVLSIIWFIICCLLLAILHAAGHI